MGRNPRDRKILCVGLTCLDMVQIVKDYPEEDSDQRSIGTRWQRGGNASNNCTILSQLGIECEYLGTIGQDLTVKFIEEDFKSMNINISNCQIVPDASTPISTVIINRKNGSRTIIHDPGTMPELAIEQFDELEMKHYGWVHFEGRNVAVVAEVLKRIHSMNSDGPKTSVELEKPRRELDTLLPLADVIFLSKDYAESRGWSSAEAAVSSAIQETRPGAAVICAWGILGAWAKQGLDGPILHSPAYPPPQAVDTLGAGDTFVSGILASQILGFNLKSSLQLACHLAGAKVGQHGMKNLGNVWQQTLTMIASQD